MNKNKKQKEKELSPINIEELDKLQKISDYQLNRNNLRNMVRGAYDLQNLRIAMGNRIIANIKVKCGIAPSKPEEKVESAVKVLLLELRDTNPKMMDGIKLVHTEASGKEEFVGVFECFKQMYNIIVPTKGDLPKKQNFKPCGVISDYTELCMLDQYIKLEDNEKEQFKRLKAVVESFAIWAAFFEGVRGCGTALAAVIISEIDIYRSKYVSSLWMYAGLDVAGDGRGRSRRKEHLIEVNYTNKKGKEEKRFSITFNPFLKTKLMGVLGGCMIKAGGPYKAIYDNYKNRLENHVVYGQDHLKTEEELKGKGRKAHRNQMAIRYMIKRFLADLYPVWKKIEGLEAMPEYSIAKLGMVHTGGFEDKKFNCAEEPEEFTADDIGNNVDTNFVPSHKLVHY